jgi:hypothetical protein
MWLNPISESAFGFFLCSDGGTAARLNAVIDGNV